MYSEDDLLPLSALSHLLFCERRCALVYIEGLWAENVFTREGSHLHEKADLPGVEARPGVRIARAVPLRSRRLGLSGKADVVEFHPPPSGSGPEIPFPVEYKRGRRRAEKSFEVQLCAQALCLEEMLGSEIPEGALYYGKTRRRKEIVLDQTLRRETERAAQRLHELLASRRTPRAAYGPKCDKCSLKDFCLPKNNDPGRSAAQYLDSVLQAAGTKSQEPRAKS